MGKRKTKKAEGKPWPHFHCQKCNYRWMQPPHLKKSEVSCSRCGSAYCKWLNYKLWT